MVIGLGGGGFPHVREALEATQPGIRVIDVPAGGSAAQVDVLIPLGAMVDAALMDTLRPRLIQQFGVGLQNVDLAAARERDIPVAFIPGDTGNAVAVAEIAIMHM
ncbi:MAG: hypothetical protein ACRDSH_01595, partial [Pseudonocardiaceae bacterium]